MTNHTVACIERTSKWERWVREHPLLCLVCCGHGYIVSPGTWVPYGSTSAQLPPDVDPCSCVESARCPRCASLLWSEVPTRTVDHVDADSVVWSTDWLPGPQRCIVCGWDELQPDAGIPAEPDCYCWEQDAG